MSLLDVEKSPGDLDSSVMDLSFHEADNLVPNGGTRDSKRRKSIQWSKLKENKQEISVIDVEYDNEDQAFHVTDEPQSQPTLTDQDLILAATYVEDARVGRHSDFKLTDRHLRLYQLYNHEIGKIILNVIILCHLLLALFEDPAPHNLLLSYWATIPIETSFLLCYIFRLIHIRMFTPATRFWSDTKHLILISIITLTFIDIVIYIGLKESGVYGVRWSRVLRPLLAVNFPEMMQIRRAFRNLRRTLPDVANVLVLFFFSLGIFALMAFKLFGMRNLKWVNGRRYFSNYWDSIFDLYVLVTTSNNPDIMMPVFDIDVGYVIFFVVFLLICYFIYMNIILAVIYNNYRTHLKNEVRKSVFSKRQRLSRAFELLAITVNDKKGVTKSRFVQLLATLPRKFSPTLVNVLWIVLDSDSSNVIDKIEFMKLADLLNVEVSEVVDKRNFFGKHIPKLYYSRCSVAVRRVVTHRYFKLTFDLLTLANAIVIGISTESSSWDDGVEWGFLSLFLLEICLNLYTYGGSFFKRLWNVFDLVVIGAAFIVGIVEAAKDKGEESRLTLDVLLVLRVLRLVRIIGNINRFKVIVLTINKIVPSLLTYGGVMLVFYYIFAIIGMEVFKGLVIFTGEEDTTNLYCSNDKLKDTEFWRDRYCNNNFNDIIHAFIVLFELTVVNQWHVIAYGYSAVTNDGAKVFFISFHLICVIVVLNIFTAFVLEVFILEYSASHSKLESQVERKIHEMGLSRKAEKKRRLSTMSTVDLVEEVEDDDDDDDDNDETDSPSEGQAIPEIIAPARSSDAQDMLASTNVRFHLSKKVKSVEVLLQKMFEKELGVDNLIHEDLHHLENEDTFWERHRSTAWHT